MQPSSDQRVDEASKKALQEVKKGKSRKFVMIKEGVQIDKLYVFKRGAHDRYVKLAKQDGVRGIAFWGVVTGDGLDIRFELSKADGFASPPGKDIRLKEFIKEATGFKFNPIYVIVDELPAVDETEADDDQQPAAVGDLPSETSTAEAPPSPAQPAAAEQAGDKFIRLLKKILPHVKRALGTPTSASDELQQRVREAQDLGRRREFDEGLVVLRTVGELAKKALAEASKSGKSALPADESAQVAQRLHELRQQCDELQVGSTSLGDDILARFQSAETQMGRKKFDRALSVITQIERLIDRARAELERRRQWEERFAQLEPRYSEAIEQGNGDTSAVKSLMQYAQGQAAQRQYVKGLVGLDRLETLLTSAS